MLGDQRFWLLVSLKLTGEINKEELKELDELIKLSPELLKHFLMLQKLWEAKTESPYENKEKSFDKHLQRLSNHLSEPVLQYENIEQTIIKNEKQPTIKYRKLKWAGAIAASFILCWVLIIKPASRSNDAPKLSSNTINAKPGFKMYIVLPDGSKVWLNADSKLTYGDKFQGRFREVFLSGEAFFDVVKDKEHPFLIHTKTIDVKVLGTAFNVRSYENEATTETALVRGSVEVTLHNNSDKKIILKPSEKLIVKNSLPDTSAQKIEPVKEQEEPLIVLSKMRFYENDSTSSVETSWTKNRLAFDKEPLKDIALKLERWYNITVSIKDKNLNEEKYTASFEDERLEEVMEALRLTGNFHYTIRKREVIIWR